MNLVADIGNSSAKIALFKGRGIVSSERYPDLTVEVLMKLLSSGKFEKAIISSVKTIPDTINKILSSKVSFVHLLSAKSKLPFRIGYLSPETLGTDRIAAVAGAHMLYNGSSSLVIDAGTALTFDLLEDDLYHGGNISPGIRMRFEALHSFTDRLPLINTLKPYESPGKTTEEAIRAGVMNGVIYEINEYIRTFEKKYPGIKVILTGGDGAFLHDKLEHKIDYIPEIVIEGLNYILEYNAK
ncbi:MAG TPA: type III pantothenate kinase [Bacteroidales bacterium]|nr:type III pantothenate kinase [Bacteroidales bacterium]